MFFFNYVQVFYDTKNVKKKERKDRNRKLEKDVLYKKALNHRFISPLEYHFFDSVQVIPSLPYQSSPFLARKR